MADTTTTTTAPVPAVPATGVLTAGMSASDAKAILAQLGINVNDVLGSSNAVGTIQNPARKPDDLLGIRSDLYTSLGVNDSQTALLAAQKASQDATNGLNKDLTALRGRPVSVSKFTGQMAQESMVRQGDIEALQNAEKLALATYQSKKSEADSQFGILESEVKEKRQYQIQYPGAGIKASDSFDKVVKKLDTYQKEQKKEAYKDTLKASLLALGESTKGSRKVLESRLKKINKTAYNQAQQEAKLKLEALRLDIENTKSTIAARGKESANNSSNLYTYDPYTGKYSDANGNPVSSVPKGAIINEKKLNENDLNGNGIDDLEEGKTSDKTSSNGLITGTAKAIWNYLW